jgi:hypothetical protein
VQIARAVQNAPNLDSIRQLAIEDQITPEAVHAPGAYLRETQVGALSANTRIAGQEFKGVLGGLQKGVGCCGVVALDVTSGGL